MQNVEKKCAGKGLTKKKEEEFHGVNAIRCDG